MMTHPPVVVRKLRTLVTDPGGALRRKYRRARTNLMRKFSRTFREEERLSAFTGPSGFWKELRQYQLSFLVEMGLEPRHCLLDIGCGPLQGGVAFIQFLNSGNYTGVDFRSEPILEAYKQIIQHGLVHKNPRLIVSNTFARDQIPRASVDFAWSCQMLYHIPPDAIADYFSAVASHLVVGGALYADILGDENPLPEGVLWNGLVHFRHTHSHLAERAVRHGLAMGRVGKIRDHGYPVPCDLQYNDMLEFRKVSTQDS